MAVTAFPPILNADAVPVKLVPAIVGAAARPIVPVPVIGDGDRTMFELAAVSETALPAGVKQPVALPLARIPVGT